MAGSLKNDVKKICEKLRRLPVTKDNIRTVASEYEALSVSKDIREKAVHFLFLKDLREKTGDALEKRVAAVRAVWGEKAFPLEAAEQVVRTVGSLPLILGSDTFKKLVCKNCSLQDILAHRLEMEDSGPENGYTTIGFLQYESLPPKLFNRCFDILFQNGGTRGCWTVRTVAKNWGSKFSGDRKQAMLDFIAENNHRSFSQSAAADFLGEFDYSDINAARTVMNTFFSAPLLYAGNIHRILANPLLPEEFKDEFSDRLCRPENLRKVIVSKVNNSLAAARVIVFLPSAARGRWIGMCVRKEFDGIFLRKLPEEILDEHWSIVASALDYMPASRKKLFTDVWEKRAYISRKLCTDEGPLIIDHFGRRKGQLSDMIRDMLNEIARPDMERFMKNITAPTEGRRLTGVKIPWQVQEKLLSLISDYLKETPSREALNLVKLFARKTDICDSGKAPASLDDHNQIRGKIESLVELIASLELELQNAAGPGREERSGKRRKKPRDTEMASGFIL